MFSAFVSRQSGRPTPGLPHPDVVLRDLQLKVKLVRPKMSQRSTLLKFARVIHVQARACKVTEKSK